MSDKGQDMFHITWVSRDKPDRHKITCLDWWVEGATYTFVHALDDLGRPAARQTLSALDCAEISIAPNGRVQSPLN